MKQNLKKYLILCTLSAVTFFSANAQRGDHSHGGGGSSAQGGGQPREGGFRQRTDAARTNTNSGGSFDRQSQHVRTFDRTPATGGGTTITADANRNNNFSRRENRIATNPAVTNQPNRVPNRNVTVNNTQVNNNYRGGNNYRYPSRNTTVINNYNYTPRRYVYAGAPRYNALPHGALTIRFGNYPYYYHGGGFYGYYNGFYEPVYAPIGIHINILPIGYYPFYYHSRRYYYYDGIYYSNNGLSTTTDYEVVDAPIGAQVSVLPKNTTVVNLNGEKFYQFNGTYYKEGVNSKNEVVYTVVGKYGQVNNTDEPTATAPTTPPAALHIGDVLPVLPEGCTLVTINGEELWLSPNNTYYKAIVNGTDTSYKIVGMQAAQ